MSITYPRFPKIPRLHNEITVTEQLDGVTVSVWIGPVFDGDDNLQVDPVHILDSWMDMGQRMVMRAGSARRWLQPGKDDCYGFANWVARNAEELRRLGTGQHFGEWWGRGIGKRYRGMRRAVFSLFNTARWGDPAARPKCCDVAPVLYTGPMSLFEIDRALTKLRGSGSIAARKYERVVFSETNAANWYVRIPCAEGVMVYHHGANQLFQVTMQDTNVDKGQLTPKLTRVEHAEVPPRLDTFVSEASFWAALVKFTRPTGVAA